MSNIPYSLAIGSARQIVPVTNLCVNPDFTANANGWVAQSFTTQTRVFDTTSNSWCLSLVATTTNNFGTRIDNTATYRIPVVAGDVIRTSVKVRNVIGSSPIFVTIFAYNGATTLTPLYSSPSTPVIVSSLYTELTHQYTVGAGATWIDIHVNTNTSGSIGNEFRLDDVIITKNEPLYPYTIPATVPSQSLSNFESWTLTRNLDDGCSMTIQMRGDSIPAVQIQELETDIWVYKSGVLLDRFRVTNVDQEWGENGENRLGVQAVCYRRLLGSRHVLSSLSYTDSQGQIVWNLIQHTQGQTNGDLGITLGSTGPNIVRTRQYQPGQNILEAITDLTQADGNMTWDIDGNLQLFVSTAGAYPLRPMPAHLGTNLRNISKPSGAALFGNVALVSGDTQFTILEVQNAPNLAADPRGRWEKYRSFSQEQVQSNLTEQADGLVESTQSPSVIWSFEMISDRFFTDSDYQIGDFVVLAQPSTVVPSQPDPTIPLLTVTGQTILVQILTLDITIDANGASSIKITAVQIPQPWDLLPTTITWDNIDPTITWDNMLSTYLI